MQFLPLLRGSAGVFDEIILLLEGVLVLALLIALFRSRKSDQPRPPVETREPPDHLA